MPLRLSRSFDRENTSPGFTFSWRRTSCSGKSVIPLSLTSPTLNCGPSTTVNVTVGNLLDVRRHLDLEIPLVLVEVPELLDGALDVYRVVDAAQLEIDLVLELRGLHGLVPGEVDVPDERPFVDDERHLHPALEVLDPHLHVVEEAQAEDRPDVLGEEGRVEGRADGDLDPAEHDGPLDPPRALDRH